MLQVRGVALPYPMHAGIASSLWPPVTLNMISGYRKLMDGVEISERAAHSLGGGWWLKEEHNVWYII